LPTKKEHLKASKKYLGYATPIVHELLDSTLPYPHEHRRTHTPQFINWIGEGFGEKAKTEAWLHFLMDYGLIRMKDVKK
jgi:hypothetical protein